MGQRSTSPRAGRSAFARVSARLGETTPGVTVKVNTAGHHPNIEPLTHQVLRDFEALRAALETLSQHTQELAVLDTTHGQRLYESVQQMNSRMVAVAQRVSEMREHVDEDTP